MGEQGSNTECRPGADSFRIRVADATIGIRPLHRDIARMCADYMIEPAPEKTAGALASGSASTGAAAPSPTDLVIAISQADIDAERAHSTDEHPWSDAYLETLAVLRRIAQWAPLHRRLLVHGAVIQYAGRAYLFTAPSGTGKSTHIMLWRHYLGSDVRVVNGDKPLVRIPEVADGAPVAYGTPWSGKEGWQENACAPLAGICLLGRSRIARIPAADSLDRIIRQVYLPDDARAAASGLELLDALLTRVPVHDLAVDMSEDAVRVSFEGLTGLPYNPAI